MSKKNSQKPVKKGSKKPVVAKKKASKPVKSASKAKAAPKEASAKPAPSKKVAKPVKSLKKAASEKKVPTPAKSKPVAVVKPVKKELIKSKAPVAKPVAAKEIKAPATQKPEPKAKKEPLPPPPPPPANLPKLPKGFVIKKQKGKLAPGEKRVFKTNVITHHIIDELPEEDIERKGKPEPKGKFTLEYIIHTPVTLLYDFLTTPNGLAEWFADGVDMKNDVYTFDWDGQKQNAKVISAKIDNHIRLRWMDKPDGYYFEFRLHQDELTNEVSLNITDFGEGEDDIATSRRLWDSQIQRLVKALGTY
jgi:uncharacterized protein YndB with AHSA1/START domain